MNLVAGFESLYVFLKGFLSVRRVYETRSASIYVKSYIHFFGRNNMARQYTEAKDTETILMIL
jgi:hypothetical protein